MALLDILFAEGDKQNFISEIPAGTLNSPIDILYDKPVMEEFVLQAAAGGNTYPRSRIVNA